MLVSQSLKGWGNLDPENHEVPYGWYDAPRVQLSQS